MPKQIPYKYRVVAGYHNVKHPETGEVINVGKGGRVTSMEPLHEKFQNKFEWMNEAEIRGIVPDDASTAPPVLDFVPESESETDEEEAESEEEAAPAPKEKAVPKQPGDEDGEWEPDMTPTQEGSGEDVTETFPTAEAKGFAVFKVGDDEYNVTKTAFKAEPLTTKPLTRTAAKKFIKESSKV